MSVPEGEEAGEGGEELIVSRDSSGGHKGADGERIDQGVVEFLVLERIGGGYGSLTTSTLGLEIGHGCRGHAESVLRGVANECLGIDCAAQVQMQVGALGQTL